MAAAAGLFAAVAPLLRWFTIDVSFAGMESTATTTGWGSTALDAPYQVPAETPGWDGWILADVPDGAIVSAFAVVVAIAGVRLALGGGGTRRFRQAATVGTLGLLGILWMAMSWFQAQRVLDDDEELIGGIARAQGLSTDDLFSLSPGTGFVVCCVAFAVAALCGLVAMRSSSFAPLEDPGARPLLPDGYVPPPAPVAAPPGPAPPGPPSPPGGWL